MPRPLPAATALSTAGVEVTARDLSGFSPLSRQRPVIGLVEAPVAEPELEPWNPEATYESLVRLLAELKAMHPHEVAVLPTRPSFGAGRRLTRLVAAVVAVGVVVGGGSLLLSHRSGPTHHAAAVAPRMSTVLVAIEANGSLVGANLLASNGSKSQEILLPSRLLVDVPGQGNAQLAQSPVSGPGAAAAAVENALHVRIDGTWVLDPATLSTLVDAVGGIDVTLTDDLLPSDGSGNIGIGAGASHITGIQASTLAVAQGTQEPEASRLARQQILVDALLTKLPTDQAQLAGLLAHAQVNGGLTPASLAGVLERMRAAVVAGSAASTVIPNNPIDSGSGTPSYGLDDSAAEAMVASRLAGAELPTPAGGRSRILVQNGIGTAGLGDIARAELVARGYAFRGGGNAASFGTGPSVILIQDSTAASRALGATIAQILGLPASAVQLDSNQTTIADVVVILGSDFTAPAGPAASAQASTTP